MTKKTYERAVKKSISMPEILCDRAADRMRELGIYQLSDYLQRLVYKDVTSQPKELTLGRD